LINTGKISKAKKKKSNFLQKNKKKIKNQRKIMKMIKIKVKIKSKRVAINQIKRFFHK
jgi:hypothetical protein